ncbi:hypothetical protein M422DRAFT_36212 [Sphaerobolus stellatus SS14]|uniref:Uncharacterized protein n=1 Tax=Sphaerobolus stellatus (strain SS14) TaxID=990650 RepID=A0A0C9TN85_SPHS4|nr:hypothetical protein M422DRAFT_36212 [Sphaerobolus stellatus SS14]
MVLVFVDRSINGIQRRDPTSLNPTSLRNYPPDNLNMRFTSTFVSTAVCGSLLVSPDVRPYPNPGANLGPKTDPLTDGCGQPSGRSCN